jgi:hypothetical protein
VTLRDALAPLAAAGSFADARTFLWMGERYENVEVADAARLIYERHYLRGSPVREAMPPRERLLAHALHRALEKARGAPRQDPDLGWCHMPGARRHAAGEPGTARVYWHLCREGALPFARALRKLDLPHHAKIANDPSQFVRADAAVLYAPRDALDVRALHEAVKPWLRPGTPAFARRIAPGVAVADDPGRGESFGLHRSRLAAEGLHEAWRAGRDPLDALEARFRAEGLDAPHLAPGRSEIEVTI